MQPPRRLRQPGLQSPLGHQGYDQGYPNQGYPNQYGNAYGQNAQVADLRFSCRVDYRGYVSNIDIKRNVALAAVTKARLASQGAECARPETVARIFLSRLSSTAMSKCSTSSRLPSFE